MDTYLPHHEEALVQGDGCKVEDRGEHSLGDRAVRTGDGDGGQGSQYRVTGLGDRGQGAGQAG